MMLVPLTELTVNSNALATGLHTCLSTVVNSSLPGQGKYLSMLVGASSSENNRIDDLSRLRISEQFHKHAHLGFIYIGRTDTIACIMELSSLEVSVFPSIKDDIDLSIISGNLQQWRTALINGSNNVDI